MGEADAWLRRHTARSGNALTVEGSTEDQPIRDAASIVLLRQTAGVTQVLMGQRGASAVFMPSKFVFPGGGVDTGDAQVPLAAPLPEISARRIGALAPAMAAAALRELAEETGLLIGLAGKWPETTLLSADWQPFARRGLLPDASPLRFVFRAITPPGRIRRFDAHFFMADASALASDPDDFSAASGELGNLAWLTLEDALSRDLPFITQTVLGRVAVMIAHGSTCDEPDRVPFFDNGSETSRVTMIV